MVKTFKNTKKGRKKIPKKPGVYNLKAKEGKTIYTGSSKNVHRRILEHHRDKKKHFSSVSITKTSTKKEATKIEGKRLKNKKPPQNKKRG